MNLIDTEITCLNCARAKIQKEPMLLGIVFRCPEHNYPGGYNKAFMPGAQKRYKGRAEGCQAFESMGAATKSEGGNNGKSM